MKNPIRPIAVILFAASMFANVGCNRKEKVLDVKTPGGGIEIQRDKKSGELDIKVEERK